MSFCKNITNERTYIFFSVKHTLNEYQTIKFELNLQSLSTTNLKLTY